MFSGLFLFNMWSLATVIQLQERQLETLKSQILEFLLETLATGSSYMCSSNIKCLIVKFLCHFQKVKLTQNDPFYSFGLVHHIKMFI